MYISWWLIILGVIIISAIAGSGKNALRGRISELENRVAELEDELENVNEEDTDDYE